MFASKDIFLKSSGGGYQISRSVRFRASATAYLNRTLTTPTNNLKWTWSGWIKRGQATDTSIFSTGIGATNTYAHLYYSSTGELNFGQINGAGTVVARKTTTALYRDHSAWYHVVMVYDSANATASNRLLMYVNGVQVTSFSISTDPSLNLASYINSAAVHKISSIDYSPIIWYYDGYLTEINFIDGQALTPSSFGETNAITGVWQPKAYTGTYGTNGFYLNFSDNSAATATTIGKDYSGNGNNWTPNNISVTAGTTYDSMTDVPTPYADGGNGRGNYAVMNPLSVISPTTISNGNLTVETGVSGGGGAFSTIAFTSGKYYFEFTATNISTASCRMGASDSTRTNTVQYNDNGNKVVNGVETSYGASYTNGDLIGVACDLVSNTITFYKNNTSQGAISYSTWSTIDMFAFCADGSGSSGITANFNFGQRPFSYTPPTGFVALNTQNLPAPTISNGANYMAATLYTGTGSALTIANTVGSASFQPDWVWVKSRSAATDHAIYDSVRGVQKQLESNTTTAETTETTGLTAFGSTGFTVGALAQMNTSAATYVAWQWNAGGSTVTNTTGTISAQVRANTTAGFSVVTYTGNATSGATVGHGLGVAPSMVIVKIRSTTGDWPVYHASTGNTKALYLNLTNSQGSNFTGAWNNTTPTSTVFTLGNSTETNASGGTMVAYCFAPVAGYSAFGSYTGNGSTDGPFVFLGFRPRFVMMKASSSTSNWTVIDTARDAYNYTQYGLYPNLSNAESNPGVMDMLSNGLKIRSTFTDVNGSGTTYIYMAFAENPFKNSLAR